MVRRDLSSISLRELQGIRQHCEAALTYNPTHDWDDVLALLLADKCQLWTGRESVMVTEIVEYPKLRACRIFLAGGKLEELIEMADALADEASSIGVDRLEVNGRPGWARMGDKLGWQPLGFCIKDLRHG
jgi:hypothetical protein